MKRFENLRNAPARPTAMACRGTGDGRPFEGTPTANDGNVDSPFRVPDTAYDKKDHWNWMRS